MTVDPNFVMCDYCGHDTRGGRSHEHYDSYSDGQVRHLVTSLCCGCECARQRAHLAKLDRERETERLKTLAVDAFDAQMAGWRVEHEAGADALAERFERGLGGVA